MINRGPVLVNETQKAELHIRKISRRTGCRRFLCSQSKLQSGPTERNFAEVKKMANDAVAGYVAGLKKYGDRRPGVRP